MTLPPIPHGERLLVVVGPSGAGKDSVLGAWRARHGGALHFARRVITRPADASERHEAVEPEHFGRLRQEGALGTWWHAHGLLYGVRHDEFAPLASGRWVVLNGSRAHLAAMRRQAPGLRAVQITAPAAVLEARLAQRGREDAEAVRRRLARQAEGVIDASFDNHGALDTTVDALDAWFRSAAR